MVEDCEEDDDLQDMLDIYMKDNRGVIYAAKGLKFLANDECTKMFIAIIEGDMDGARKLPSCYAEAQKKAKSDLPTIQENQTTVNNNSSAKAFEVEEETYPEISDKTDIMVQKYSTSFIEAATDQSTEISDETDIMIQKYSTSFIEAATDQSNVNVVEDDAEEETTLSSHARFIGSLLSATAVGEEVLDQKELLIKVKVLGNEIRALLGSSTTFIESPNTAFPSVLRGDTKMGHVCIDMSLPKIFTTKKISEMKCEPMYFELLCFLQLLVLTKQKVDAAEMSFDLEDMQLKDLIGFEFADVKDKYLAQRRIIFSEKGKPRKELMFLFGFHFAFNRQMKYADCKNTWGEGICGLRASDQSVIRQKLADGNPNWFQVIPPNFPLQEAKIDAFLHFLATFLLPRLDELPKSRMILYPRNRPDHRLSALVEKEILVVRKIPQRSLFQKLHYTLFLLSNFKLLKSSVYPGVLSNGDTFPVCMWISMNDFSILPAGVTHVFSPTRQDSSNFKSIPLPSKDWQTLMASTDSGDIITDALEMYHTTGNLTHLLLYTMGPNCIASNTNHWYIVSSPAPEEEQNNLLEALKSISSGLVEAFKNIKDWSEYPTLRHVLEKLTSCARTAAAMRNVVEDMEDFKFITFLSAIQHQSECTDKVCELATQIEQCAVREDKKKCFEREVKKKADLLLELMLGRSQL